MMLLQSHWLRAALLLWLPWIPQVSSVTSDRFERTSVCNSAILQSDGCLTVSPLTTARSHSTQCAALCARTPGCTGFLFDSGECKTYNSDSCSTTPTPCTSGESEGVTWYTRVIVTLACGDYGTWDGDSGTCQCSDGYVGATCDQLLTSCWELRQNGYDSNVRAAYFIQPAGFTSPVTVHCSFTNTEVRTFFIISTGRTGFFNRTWADYVSGFRDGDTDVWMGLEVMAHLSLAIGPIKTRFIAYMNAGSLIYTYTNFQIGGSSSNYAAKGSLSSFTPNGSPAEAATLSTDTQSADGCFTLDTAVATPFSTIDSDNDNSLGSHCAQQAKAGWWFADCSNGFVCNPLGKKYATMSEAQTNEHMAFPYVNAQAIDTFINYVAFFVERL